MNYQTPTGRVNKGVATTFLAQKHPEDGQPLPRVPIFIRKSQFRLPSKPETPIIMIGPGTGLAPFRGFIQERHLQKEENKNVGDTILYFGCRKRSEDYIYEDVRCLTILTFKFMLIVFFFVIQELEDFASKGSLKLRLAFSRDQKEKVYVTHLLEQDTDLIWDIIENKGHFYLCGSVDAKNCELFSASNNLKFPL